MQLLNSDVNENESVTLEAMRKNPIHEYRSIVKKRKHGLRLQWPSNFICRVVM